MQWGMTTLIWHKYALEHCFKAVSELGVKYIELNCVRGYYEHCNAFQLADSPDELQRIAGWLRKYDLKCSALDCHGMGGWQTDEFDYSIEYMYKSLQVAQALDAPLLVTSYPNGPAAWDKLVTETRKLCKKAAQSNIGVAIEVEYNYHVGSLESLEQFMDEVDIPNLSVNFDCSHFVRAGMDVAAVVRALFPKISHVHCKEYLPEAAYSTRYTGEAGSPCDIMLDTLCELGFNGVVSAETLADPSVDPQVAAAEIMAGINKWKERYKVRAV